MTEQRWIACLVEDRIAFGLDLGEELKIHETICDEIRASGEAVVIDDASDDIKWSRYPVPVIYGFKSYCSFSGLPRRRQLLRHFVRDRSGPAPCHRRSDHRTIFELCQDRRGDPVRSCRSARGGRLMNVLVAAPAQSFDMLSSPRTTPAFCDGFDAFCFFGASFFGFRTSLFDLRWPFAMSQFLNRA